MHGKRFLKQKSFSGALDTKRHADIIGKQRGYRAVTLLRLIMSANISCVEGKRNVQGHLFQCPRSCFIHFISFKITTVTTIRLLFFKGNILYFQKKATMKPRCERIFYENHSPEPTSSPRLSATFFPLQSGIDRERGTLMTKS